MSLYLNLFLMFFRTGVFGFGGGYAILPLIFQSVQNFGLMTHAEFSNLVALSQIVPGALIVNAATYVGFTSGGVAGAAVAVFGVALPSFILVLTAMFFLRKFKESKALQGAFSGIRPAVVGLIAAAAVFIGQPTLVNIRTGAFTGKIGDYINLIPCAIFACSAVLIWKLKVHPILIMIAMGVIGAFTCG